MKSKTMTLEFILISYPNIIPLILLMLGAIYYNYLLMRYYSHFHWNLFMMSLGLLTAVFFVRLLNIFFPYGYIELIMNGAIALSALLFAFTAYVATVSDTKWRS